MRKFGSTKDKTTPQGPGPAKAEFTPRGPGPAKAAFTLQERASYAIAHQLDKYPENDTRKKLAHDLRRIALNPSIQGRPGSDPVFEVFDKAWKTEELDAKNYIRGFIKGKIIVTDGKKKVRVENYTSGKANEEIGGAVDYTDVETLSRTGKYNEELLRSAFTLVERKDQVYTYNTGILSEDMIKDLAKIAALREFKEEIGLSLDSLSDREMRHTIKKTYFGDVVHVFTLTLKPEEYTKVIEEPLDKKERIEHLNQSETSKIWWNKYLKYKSKYLKLKKKFSHVF